MVESAVCDDGSALLDRELFSPEKNLDPNLFIEVALCSLLRTGCA